MKLILHLNENEVKEGRYALLRGIAELRNSREIAFQNRNKKDYESLTNKIVAADSVYNALFNAEVKATQELIE